MLSLASKYALRALQHLSKAPDNHFVQVAHVAELVGVPGPYLAKVIKALARAGLVETKRGAMGGVRLVENRLSESISFYEVCQALNDPVLTESCLLSKSRCKVGKPCEFHGEYSKLKEELARFLKRAKISR